MTTKEDTSGRKRKHRLADRIKRDKRLGKLDRLVGCYLANLCDAKEEYAFALQETIAAEFQVSVRSVGRAVRKLELIGYFRRKRAGGRPGDAWGSNTYHPNWSMLTGQDCPIPPALDAAGSDACPVGTSEMSGGIGQDCPVGSDKSDGSDRTEVSDVMLPEHYPQPYQKPYQVNCAPGRTVPVGASHLVEQLNRLATVFPGDAEALHNDQPAVAFLDDFADLIGRHGFEGVVSLAEARKRQTGRPLTSMAHFLANEAAAA